MTAMPTELTRGDRHPDALITIADAEADANFTSLLPAHVRVVGEQEGVIVFNAQPSAVTAAADGKSAQVRYVWGAGDTDEVGILYVTVEVTWPATGRIQHFPGAGPLMLHIRRAPGDL